jgi:hypothetical protein
MNETKQPSMTMENCRKKNFLYCIGVFETTWSYDQRNDCVYSAGFVSHSNQNNGQKFLLIYAHRIFKYDKYQSNFIPSTKLIFRYQSNHANGITEHWYIHPHYDPNSKELSYDVAILRFDNDNQCSLSGKDFDQVKYHVYGYFYGRHQLFGRSNGINFQEQRISYRLINSISRSPLIVERGDNQFAIVGLDSGIDGKNSVGGTRITKEKQKPITVTSINQKSPIPKLRKLKNMNHWCSQTGVKINQDQ